jgi:hypothetical protein
MTGTRATWMAIGAVAGLALAAGLVFLSTRDAGDPSAVGDLLAVAFAVLALGWVVGPVWTGESVLRPDQFRLLPIPSRRLALGLLAAAFVGIGAVVTALSLTSLIVYASRLGRESVAVAVPAVVLQLVLVVVLSRLAAGTFGRLTTSRLGGAAAGMATAAILVVSQWGWVVFERADHVLTTGLSESLSMFVRALPSGWVVVAVDAAQRSEWAVVAGVLAGLAALIVALMAIWSRVLASPRAARATIRGSADAGLERTFADGATRAVAIKELRSWWRDPARTDLLVVAPAFALLTALLPLIYDSTGALPWAGPIAALLAAATSANLYGLDGTALWLTLLTPGVERHEVRGRQWAWVAIFGPVTLAITVAFTLLSGQTSVWPWVLAVTASLLGGGAGLVVFVAVTQLAPGPDPRRRASALDHGDTTGQGILTVFAGLLPAAPAAAVLLAGEAIDSEALRWAGVPVGIGVGWFVAWWLGLLASRRLVARGAELLQLMRTGKITAPTSETVSTGAIEAMPGRAKALFFSCIWIGSIALFPQGIVPLAIKLSQGDERVWFLALYLPEPWQWPTVALMIALGLASYWVAFRIYRRQRSVVRRAAGGRPGD